MSNDGNASGDTEREIDRCEVCNKTDYLEPIPLTRPTKPRAVDLKTCETCKRALRDYFDTGSEILEHLAVASEDTDCTQDTETEQA